ncbi:class B sortase [Ruminococcus sp. zg-921]|nr:class B sortase [Ruminococcus sp. zg-921]
MSSLRNLFNVHKPRYGTKNDIVRNAVVALAAVFLAVAVLCASLLLSTQRQYNESGDYYSKISADISPENNSKNLHQSVTMSGEELSNIGKDVVGWITFPDTQIDYPVAQCDNNSYYCYHLPDGSYNVGGTIFMDMLKSKDMKSRNTVLYGHHMKNGSMFQNITYYKNSTFFEDHKTAYYYTANGDYEIQIAYGFVISSHQWNSEEYIKDANMMKLVEYAKENTTFNSGVEITATDRIMTFSTCSYEFSDANYMLIGKVVPLIVSE